MKGKHRVVVSTKRLRYDFELRRNLTIIRGDSATGKTTLVDTGVCEQSFRKSHRVGLR